jgi:hypothetical protein
MTTTKPTSRRLTRYLAGPALALGVALGSAAVANAVPEWDIGAFDDCERNITESDAASGPFYWDRKQGCCIGSGGVWRSTDGVHGECVAPPAESQGRNPLSSDAPTHVMQPSPLPGPPGDIGPAPGGVLTSSP